MAKAKAIMKRYNQKDAYVYKVIKETSIAYNVEKIDYWKRREWDNKHVGVLRNTWKLKDHVTIIGNFYDWMWYAND